MFAEHLSEEEGHGYFSLTKFRGTSLKWLVALALPRDGGPTVRDLFQTSKECDSNSRCLILLKLIWKR